MYSFLFLETKEPVKLDDIKREWGLDQDPENNSGTYLDNGKYQLHQFCGDMECIITMAGIKAELISVKDKKIHSCDQKKALIDFLISKLPH